MTPDLPDLSGAYALSQEQIASFRRDGHVLLRGVASADEVAAYRRPIAAELMGVLTFATGSHADGPLCALAISEESDDFYERTVRERGFPVRRDAMKAGDATFHSGWTVHMAPGNHTNRCREVMTVIYMADGGLFAGDSWTVLYLKPWNR